MEIDLTKLLIIILFCLLAIIVINCPCDQGCNQGCHNIERFNISSQTPLGPGAARFRKAGRKVLHAVRWAQGRDFLNSKLTDQSPETIKNAKALGFDEASWAALFTTKVQRHSNSNNSNDSYSNDSYSNDSYSNANNSNDSYSNDSYSNDSYSNANNIEPFFMGTPKVEKSPYNYFHVDPNSGKREPYSDEVNLIIYKARWEDGLPEVILPDVKLKNKKVLKFKVRFEAPFGRFITPPASGMAQVNLEPPHNTRIVEEKPVNNIGGKEKNIFIDTQKMLNDSRNRDSRELLELKRNLYTMGALTFNKQGPTGITIDDCRRKFGLTRKTCPGNYLMVSKVTGEAETKGVEEGWLISKINGESMRGL